MNSCCIALYCPPRASQRHGELNDLGKPNRLLRRPGVDPLTCLTIKKSKLKGYKVVTNRKSEDALARLREGFRIRDLLSNEEIRGVLRALLIWVLSDAVRYLNNPGVRSAVGDVLPGFLG